MRNLYTLYIVYVCNICYYIYRSKENNKQLTRPGGTRAESEDIMKFLENKAGDTFDTLEKAKRYYYPSEEEDRDVKDPDGYINNVIPSGLLESWKNYKNEIKEAETLEELANTLNKYTDTFGDGSEVNVREI